MTLDEILGMEAGPELDRLVAENVMGWIAPTDIDGVRGWLRWCEEEQRYVWAGWWIESPPTDENGEIDPIWLLAGDKVWSPSTDIADAWVVVQQLAQGLELAIAGSPDDIWRVAACNPAESMPWPVIEAEAPTAPLAICRAALLTVLREEGQHGD